MDHLHKSGGIEDVLECEFEVAARANRTDGAAGPLYSRMRNRATIPRYDTAVRKTSVSLADLAAAENRLLAKGISPSQDRLAAELSASKTTIGKLCKQREEEHEALEAKGMTLPASVRAVMFRVAHNIMSIERSRVEPFYKGELEDKSRLLRETAFERDELKVRLGEAESMIVSQNELIEELKSDLEDASTRSAALQRFYDRFLVDAEGLRDRVSDLEQTLAKSEQMAHQGFEKPSRSEEHSVALDDNRETSIKRMHVDAAQPTAQDTDPTELGDAYTVSPDVGGHGDAQIDVEEWLSEHRDDSSQNALGGPETDQRASLNDEASQALVAHVRTAAMDQDVAGQDPFPAANEPNGGDTGDDIPDFLKS